MDMEDKSLNFEALMDWKVLNRRSGCPWEFTEEDGSWQDEWGADAQLENCLGMHRLRLMIESTISILSIVSNHKSIFLPLFIQSTKHRV